MKKFISIILALICMAVSANAEQLNKDINKGLFAESADRLVCVELDEKTKVLPDFSDMAELFEITVHENNDNYKSVDGVLYSKDGKTLICYPSKKAGDIFVCPDGVEKIMSGAFSENENLKIVFLPASISETGTNPFSKCKNLKSVEVSEKNRYFSSADGILYDKDKNRLIACPCAMPKVHIPESVTEIGYGAFSGCDKLHEIEFPKALTVLESMALSGCTGIKRIVIPKKVEKLNLSCFKGCKNLEEIKVENSEYYKSVDGILYSFDMYELIYCPEGKKGEIAIPSGVRYILNGAFDNCEKITRVITPADIKNIARAFYRCTSLKNIEIPGEQAILEYGTFEGCAALEWVYLPNNVVIIQENAIPESAHIICDEDSFASFYAEENEMSFGFKYDVKIADNIIRYSNQPFFEKGSVYLHVEETVKALGGEWIQNGDKNRPCAVLGNVTVGFESARAERFVMNQSEYIKLENVKFRNEDFYLKAEEFADILGIKCKVSGNTVTLFE